MPGRSFSLKLGFACNNNCLSCSQAHKKHLGELSTEKVKSFLTEAIQKGQKTLILTGGEPTVRPDLVEIVEFAKNSGFKRIVLQTNGRMLSYKKYCSKLARAGVKRFMFGFHGAKPETHNFVSQSNDAFEQSVQGIKNLKELGRQVIVNFVANKLNYTEMPEAAKLFIGLKVDKSIFSFISCSGNALDNIDLLLPRMSEVMPYFHEALDTAIAGGLTARTCSYPFCFLKGYEKCCEELYAPLRSIRYADVFHEDFEENYDKTMRCKGPMCGKCGFDAVCIGPRKEYPEKFGWSEFKPALGLKIGSADDLLG
jgi:MoaA/NifB/PqqE/SkfB family radical SAM enzyme